MAGYSKAQLLEHIRLIIGVYEKNPGADKQRPYRIKTFKGLISKLEPLSDEQIQQVASGALPIKGIGPSSKTLIKQFLTRGTTDRYQDIKDEISPAEEITAGTSIPQQQAAKNKVTNMLRGIHGVGQVIADKWYDLGIRTIEDVALAQEKQYINLNHQQQIGYYYYHHLTQRIPRAEMDLLAGRVQQLLGGAITFEICGSYRRGSPNSGDIDVLVQNNGQYSFQQVIDLIQSDNQFIVAVLTPEAKKVYMAVCRLGPEYMARRIDIKFVPLATWGSALLHYTGPDNLNKAMREVAISKGLKLSEYGLQNVASEQYYDVKTEQDVFAALGLQYLTPVQRQAYA